MAARPGVPGAKTSAVTNALQLLIAESARHARRAAGECGFAGRAPVSSSALGRPVLLLAGDKGPRGDLEGAGRPAGGAVPQPRSGLRVATCSLTPGRPRGAGLRPGRNPSCRELAARLPELSFLIYTVRVSFASSGGYCGD